MMSPGSKVMNRLMYEPFDPDLVAEKYSTHRTIHQMFEEQVLRSPNQLL